MTNPNLADLASDADEYKQEVRQNPVALQDLIRLGEELEALESDAADLELKLKNTNKKAQELRINKLPKLMVDLGLPAFTLSDGTVIEVNDIINGKITDQTRDEAHQWLREHGHEDLIKNEVLVVFGKGEDKYAKHLLEAIDFMREGGELHCGSVDQKERVHPQTLGAFLRDLVKSGQPFPSETFNLEILKMAKLKRAGEKRV